MKTPRYESGDNVHATDADGRVYDGVVRYVFSVPGPAFAYGIEIAEIDGAVLQFPESSIRLPPEPSRARGPRGGYRHK